MRNIFIDFLPPWVETGLQPAFYDKESGTVLQQTARMYAKVNELIASYNSFTENITNQQNDFEQRIDDTVDEYIEKFIALKDFVDNYFDNLDVQEEINNKLDAMVEAGTLQEIIAVYLNATAVWGFDTVADMKVSSNLIEGSFAKTLGYHAKNDGGEGLYKIRQITNDDVVDEALIIEMADDTLVAELIIRENNVTPEQFGCYGDNTHDDTVNLQKALDSGYDVITSKNYLITNTINVNYSLIMDSDSFIHFSSSVTGLGVGVAHTLGRQMINKTYNINVNAHGYSTVAIGLGRPKKCKIKLYVRDAGTTGVHINYYNDTGNNENQFTIDVIGNDDGTTENGVIWNGYDSIVSHIITQDCHTGVLVDHGELIATSVHSWLSTDTVATLWSGSSCIKTTGGFHVNVEWLYQDSLQYGISGNGINGKVGLFEYNNAFDTSIYTGMVNVYMPDYPIVLLIGQFTNNVVTTNLITYDNHNNYKNSLFGVTGIDGASPYYQNHNYHAQFTDANLAPQICSKYCKYDVTNLPTTTNGELKSEVLGDLVRQTFYPSNVANNVRYWERYRTFNSTTWSAWTQFQPYTAS